MISGRFTEPTRAERSLLGKSIEAGWRLACQARPLSDAVIEIRFRPSRVSKLRKRADISIDPKFYAVPVHNYKRSRPSDEEILLQYLAELGLEDAEFIKGALARVGELEDGSSFFLMVDGKTVRDISKKRASYGLAVDIGTTTVAASLVDLSDGRLVDEEVDFNAQIRYGSDIISRIGYSATGKEGLGVLRKAVVETINQLIERMCRRQKINPKSIYRVCVAGNSVMTHIFFGIPPRHLGSIPFEPVFRRSLSWTAGEAGIMANPLAEVYSLPLPGGYIGGDVVGDIIASGMLNDGTSMLIDVGTNGEIVVKRGDGLYATSVPAGPAFEGVGVTSGMPAIEGAIFSFKEEGGELRYRTIGDRAPLGICGSGYIDLLAELIKAGTLDTSGRFRVGSSDRLRRRGGVLEYVVVEAQDSDGGEDITLTQVDVRRLQLVVSAFKTAMTLLLREVGVGFGDLDRVYVAGAFGYSINRENAVLIGLLPPIDYGKIEAIGNGSLSGAEATLLSTMARALSAEILAKIKVINMPRSLSFQKTFIEMLKFSWG